MKKITTDWTREELEAYTLIYFANADYEESKDEDKYIRHKTSKSTFEKMHKEFEKDNDFQSIQKIEYTVEALKYKKSEIEELFKEIKELSNEDGDFDIREKSLMQGLKHILE